MEIEIYYEDVDGICLYDNESKYGISIDRDIEEKDFEMYEILFVFFDDNENNEIYEFALEIPNYLELIEEVVNLYGEYDNNADYCTTEGFECEINNFKNDKIKIATEILKIFMTYI